VTPQQYLDSIGLGHLRTSAEWNNYGPAALVPLAADIALTIEPDTEDRFGGVWLVVDGSEPAGETPTEAEAVLDRMAREAEANAARYRAALAVLRGDAPQPQEVTP
jgi:hypothetical protein